MSAGSLTLGVLTTGVMLHLVVCSVARWGSLGTLRCVRTVTIGLAVLGPVILLPVAPVGRMIGVIALTYPALEALALSGKQREILRRLPRRCWLVFTLMWPGVVPSTLRPGDATLTDVAGPPRWLLRGVRNVALGLAALAALVVAADRLNDLLLGLGVVLAILVMLHLGASELIAVGARLITGAGERPFPDPLASTSLAEFWGHRWNRPFAELGRTLLMPPLRRFGPRTAVVGVFAMSALLHELAISYPAGAGYGLPTAYFLTHGFLVTNERRLRVRRWPVAARRLWTLTLVGLPLPLLFHQAFRDAVIVGPIRQLNTSLPPLANLPLADVFAAALLAAGIAHGLVLVASIQVPTRLGWREDLATLNPFNRKLMWVYGGFIAGTIAAFGLLTLILRPHILRGEPAAIALALLIGLWWTARVVIDALVFDHNDWPQGWTFTLGHIALTGLFIALAATYLATVAWHTLPTA